MRLSSPYLRATPRRSGLALERLGIALELAGIWIQKRAADLSYLRLRWSR